MKNLRTQSNYLSIHARRHAGRRSLQAIMASLPIPASNAARAGRVKVSLTKRAWAVVSLQASGGCATPSVAAANSFAAGSFPQQVAVGDFNGDGKLDLVTANFSSIDVSVLLGDGKGGFGDKTDFPAGVFPQSITIGDFNLDGKLDLAVAADFDGVSVLLGDGLGGFSEPTNFPAANSVVEDGFPVSVTVGDFNLDGKPDIATALTPSKVSVLLGDGLGGFSKPTTFPAGRFPFQVTVGDFNLDGKPDLVTANLGAANVSVLLGDGAGGFGDKTDFPAGVQPTSVTVGDFNLDGKPDIAVANFGPSTGLGPSNVSVLLGNGAGGFSDKTDFPVANGAESVAVGDFNLDGATANVPPNNVSVLLGNGLGSFNVVANPAVASIPDSVMVGDFNGDGKPDLVTSNANPGKVSVLLSISSDLAITMSDSPDPVVTGSNLTYTIPVTNNGPDAAADATVTDSLPAGVNFVSAASSQGSCTQSAGTLTCNLGALANGAAATVTIVVTPTATGTISNTASVTSGVCDPNTANNSATQSTTVNSPNRCPQPMGFWKNNPAAWPVSTLTLGSQTYTQAELLTILNTPIRSDASLILAKQLIAAKLNIANGSDPAPISSAIAGADSLLSGFAGRLPYNVRTSTATGQAMTNDASVLENYNSGLLTPGCAP